MFLVATVAVAVWVTVPDTRDVTHAAMSILRQELMTK
jgi:hypothetical protein